MRNIISSLEAHVALCRVSLGALFLALVPVVHASQSPLIRTIAVAGDPLQVLVDQTTGFVLVPGGTIMDRYGNFDGPPTLTILDGKAGRVVKVFPPRNGIDVEPVSAVDGSARVYINTANVVENTNGAVQQLTSDGTLHLAGFSLPPLANGPVSVHVPVAVDRQRSRFVAFGLNFESVDGYDLHTGRQVYSLPIPLTNGADAAFVVDRQSGSLFVLSNASLQVLDEVTGHVRASVPISGPACCLALAATLHRLVTFVQGQIQVWDTRALQLIGSTLLPPSYPPEELAPFAPAAVHPLAIDAIAGHAIVLSPGVQVDSGTAQLIDLHSGTVVRTVTVGGYPYAVAVDPPLHRAFIANRDTNDVAVIDTRTGAVLARVRAGNLPESVAVDERSQTVFVVNSYSATATTSGTVTMFDARITGTHE
ncbi:MAG TPA: hypothetical protein VHB98_12900 [Chloroflexota bacterium]|nr:hypothetical protein [Chloroflexota bacterium]